MTSARGMGILSHVACVYIATAASTRVASAQAIHQPGAFARHRASSSPSLCASGLGFPQAAPEAVLDDDDARGATLREG